MVGALDEFEPGVTSSPKRLEEPMAAAEHTDCMKFMTLEQLGSGKT